MTSNNQGDRPRHRMVGGRPAQVMSVALLAATGSGCGAGVVGAVDAANNGNPGNPTQLTAVLEEGLIVENSDGRRGIPLPFRLSGVDGEVIELVFQWSRSGTFPPLPSDPDEIRALLADPVRRRELQIASELPIATGGRVRNATADVACLPELASSAAGLLAPPGVVGRELEILRKSTLPAPLAAAWRVHPLRFPIAALPIEAGSSALVLDRPAAGSWRLVRVDLATGEGTPIATSIGDPGALAFEAGGLSVLVASDQHGDWRLERVDLRTASVRLLVRSGDGATERGPVRGLASLGRDAALLTVGNSLVRASHPAGEPPRAIAIRADLQTPWGVLPDPLATNRVYVAEREAPVGARTGRVVAIDLETRALSPLLAELPRPRALALEHSGARLLIVTDAVAGDGQSELMGVDLRGAQGNEAFEITALPAEEVRSLATGPAGLRLLTLSDLDDLAVGGGVEQRRSIQSYAPAGQEAKVTRPFDPPLAPLTPWRVLHRSASVAASRAGTPGTFVWDSRDLDGGGEVLFRVLPFGRRTGLAGTSGGPHAVRLPFQETDQPLRLGGGPGSANPTVGPLAGTAADLDGDGDLDLVSANASNRLTIFFQTSPGEFDPVPKVLGDGVTTRRPASVAAADLDGDGDLDLVSANSRAPSNNLTLFFQTSPGEFDPVPMVLGGAGTTGGASSVAAADLDGDGDLDLVSANSASNTLTLFLQSSPGSFDPVPTLVVGGAGTTDGPVAVVVADMDGDGDPDLASANSRGNDLTVFFQTAGSFDPLPLELGDPSTTSVPNGLTAADLDGDGDLDLVSANLGEAFGPTDTVPSEFGSNLTLFFQTSPGVFDPRPTLILGDISSTPDPSSVSAVDLVGDGDLDLAATIQSLDLLTINSHLAFFFQTRPGVFETTPRELGDLDLTGSPAALVAADLNADGSLDLVSFNSGMNGRSPADSGDDLTLFFGSAGALSFHVKASGLTEPVIDVAAADLDGDGDPDLLAIGPTISTSVSLLSQFGPGVFDPPRELGGSSQGLSQALADLDGDGDLDIAVTAFDVVLEEPGLQSGVRVLFQTRPGTFGESSALPIPPPPGASPSSLPAAIQAADLDGDGDQDLVVATWLSAQLTLLFQEGSGTFDPAQARTLQAASWRPATSPPPLTRGIGPSSVVAADLDGDGDLDLASSNGTVTPFTLPYPQGGDVTLFFQTDPGLFDPPSVIGTDRTKIGGEIDAADMDADGDLDLFTANGLGNEKLTLFFQTSPGVFDVRPSRVLGDSETTKNPLSIEAADLDADGDLDLVSANSGNPFGGGVTVFRQTSPGQFAVLPVALVATGIRMPQVVKAADLDGDGEMDLLVGDSFFGVTILYGGHD